MKIFVMRRRTVVGRALLQVLVWSLVYNWMSILPSEGFDAISIISPLQSLIPAWPFSYSICISGRRLSSTCRGDICVGAAGLGEPCYCTYVCVCLWHAENAIVSPSAVKTGGSSGDRRRHSTLRRVAAAQPRSTDRRHVVEQPSWRGVH